MAVETFKDASSLTMVEAAKEHAAHTKRLRELFQTPLEDMTEDQGVEARNIGQRLNELAPKVEEYTATIEAQRRANLPGLPDVAPVHKDGTPEAKDSRLRLRSAGDEVSLRLKASGRPIGQVLRGDGLQLRADWFMPQTRAEAFRMKSILGSDSALAGVDTEFEIVDRPTRVAIDPTFGQSILDVIPEVPTTDATASFWQETVGAEAAAPKDEGAAFAEANVGYALVSRPLETVGAILPITDEVQENESRLRGIVEGRLATFLLKAERNQVLAGTGTSPQLVGVLNTAGTQSQAQSTDTFEDAAFKAWTKVVTAGFTPNAFVLHPSTWEPMRLRTGSGVYLLGPPGDAAPLRLWGTRVVLDTNVPVEGAPGNKVIVCGAFQEGWEIHRRANVTVDSTDSDGTNFQKGIVLLRVRSRLALAAYNPASVCIVTSAA